MKVNWGCGSIQPDDWLNIDNDPSFNAKTDTFDLPDNSVEAIVAHHVLDCMPPRECEPAIAELHRVLKPNGVLRVSIGDILRAFRAYLEVDTGWFPVMDHEPLDEKFSHYLTWYGQRTNPMTRECIKMYLAQAGFKTVLDTAYNRGVYHELDSRPKESIYVEAIK